MQSFPGFSVARPRTAACLLVLPLLCLVQDAERPGYDDTPELPGGEWRVHDKARPRPPVVRPGADTAPPSDATVLFDGTSLAAWTGKDGKAGWTLEGGAMRVNGTGDIRTRAQFGDCQLHLEFRTPEKVQGASQGRGNSGVFFFERYEVQILDSFDNPTYADGQAAALYGQFPPAVNASRAPGEWQSYDILFRAPRFAESGRVLEPARVTVLHNGVCVHLDRAMLGATAHRRVARYRAHGPKGAIRLQDHGNPVEFRNIWIRELP